jgi:hypothetical protein
MFDTYNSKPSKVDAILITEENIEKVAKNLGTKWVYTHYSEECKPLSIEFENTLHNTKLFVKVGEYLCRMSPEDLYPCNAEVFEKKYSFDLKSEPKSESIISNDELSEISKKTIQDLTEEAIQKFNYAQKMGIEGLKKQGASLKEIQYLELSKTPMSQGFVNGYINALLSYKLIKISKD